jgi:predicted acylesterase/phospholipase RssA
MFTKKNLKEHLENHGKPKRILSLDGGGVRGMLTLSFLKSIEDLLKARHGNDPDFRLCHYFDLIAGTSTGAIIASKLAVGHKVEFIQQKYRELVNSVFSRSLLRWGIIRSKFRKKELEKALQEEDVLGRLTTIGSPNLKTGLLIMTKRIDTGSPWPITNNPKGKYFGPGPNSIANANYPLWKVVRASTAAPYYFKPEHIEVATETENGKTKTVVGDFVDGGVSTSNNPALQVFQVATLEGFNLNWQTGADKILLISVGTGLRNPKGKIPGFAAGHALKAMVSIMDDCNALVETMLQWMSVTETARKIDSEIGTLVKDQLAKEPLLTYQRYNVEFNPKWMTENLDETFSEKALRSFEKMDNTKNIDELARIGTIAAGKQIKKNHFPKAFDL